MSRYKKNEFFYGFLQAQDCHLCQYNDISKEMPVYRANDRNGKCLILIKMRKLCLIWNISINWKMKLSLKFDEKTNGIAKEIDVDLIEK